MPDEDQLFVRPADPPIERRTRFSDRSEDLKAPAADPASVPDDGSLEVLMAQIARLPTRRELARLALVILFVGAVLGIVATEAFWRYLPACGS